MNTKTLLPVLLIPSCVMLVPLAALLFKAEGFAWSLADFVFCWVFIAGTVFAYKLVTSRATNSAYRVATAVGVTTGLVLVWINGAVGLIGSEDNPANLMYGGVLAIGLVGAVLARLEPLGMSRALFATAFAQFLVPVIAFAIRRPDFNPGVAQVFALNFFFVVMFAVSGLLFRQAGTQPRGVDVRRTA